MEKTIRKITDVLVEWNEDTDYWDVSTLEYEHGEGHQYVSPIWASFYYKVDALEEGLKTFIDYDLEVLVVIDREQNVIHYDTEQDIKEMIMKEKISGVWR